MAPNGSATDGLRGLIAEAKTMAASPLLYIGAITVVAANEIAALLPLSNFLTALSLLPIALALLYGQLTLLAALQRRGHGSRCA